MKLPGYGEPLRLLRSCAGVAVLAILTGGCHKKVRATQASTPPVTSAHRHASHGASGTARRTPAPSHIPATRAPVDENLPATGLVASSETGLASWYGPPYSNRRGANGEIYDANAMTAAHRTLPMGTVVRVTNLATSQSVIVKITDRGPFVRGRLIDLSVAAAKSTGVYRMGVAQVRVQVLEQRAGAMTPGRWCVQIGAFLDESNADRLKRDLLHRYSEGAKVIEFPGPTGHWVRVNPVAGDRKRAAEIAGTIHPTEPGAQSYLVRLD